MCSGDSSLQSTEFIDMIRGQMYHTWVEMGQQPSVKGEVSIVTEFS